MSVELTDTENRVLIYLYLCEQMGRKPSAFDLDITTDELEKAIARLVEVGFVEAV